MWDKSTSSFTQSSLANSYTHVDTQRHTHTHTAAGTSSYYFCVISLVSRDAWCDRLLADAKSLVMLCAEVK